MSQDPSIPPPDFSRLLSEARNAASQAERRSLIDQAHQLARREHYDAAPAPSSPSPAVANLRRACVFHLRFLDLLQVYPDFAPHFVIASRVREIWKRMDELHNSQTVSVRPPLRPEFIPTGNDIRGNRPVVEPAREATQAILALCASVQDALSPTAPAAATESFTVDPDHVVPQEGAPAAYRKGPKARQDKAQQRNDLITQALAVGIEDPKEIFEFVKKEDPNLLLSNGKEILIESMMKEYARKNKGQDNCNSPG